MRDCSFVEISRSFSLLLEKAETHGYDKALEFFAGSFIMKKRNFIILIVLFLLVLTLSACGRRQTESANSLPAAWTQTDKDATQPGLSFPQRRHVSAFGHA